LGPRKEIDDLYINRRYYIVPDGELGQQARKLAAVL
jgi:non-homologous end joining protein Ku